MIKTEKLTKLFATEEVQTKALNEVTLQVEQGEFVAIWVLRDAVSQHC